METLFSDDRGDPCDRNDPCLWIVRDRTKSISDDPYAKIFSSAGLPLSSEKSVSI